MYHQPHGKMHSTSKWPSLSERGSGLSGMWWTLWLEVVLVLFLALQPLGE